MVADSTRQKVIRAATDLYTTFGVLNISRREIAKSSGFTAGTVTSVAKNRSEFSAIPPERKSGQLGDRRHCLYLQHTLDDPNHRGYRERRRNRQCLANGLPLWPGIPTCATHAARRAQDMADGKARENFDDRLKSQ